MNCFKTHKTETITKFWPLLEYFQFFSHNPNDPSIVESKRSQILLIICENFLHSVSLGRVKVPTELFKVLLSTNLEDPLLNIEIVQNKMFSDHYEKGYFSFGIASLMYKKLRLIEKYIENSLKKKEDSEVSLAFQNFSFLDSERSKNTILFIEPAPGVHGELQVLGEIIRMASAKNLSDVSLIIGVSQKTCKDCSSLLESSKILLKKCYNIEIFFPK